MLNEPFDSLTPERIQQRHQVHNICSQFNKSPSKGNLSRLKALFNSVGESVFIEAGFHCDYGDKITLGDRVYLNINCTLLDGGLISIGNDVLIGPNVQIITINHALSPAERLEKTSFASSVIIESNVWIGAGVIILPGVTIEEGSVIAAGSVVNRNVTAHCLYAGNPAKKIRLLDTKEEL